MIAIPALISVSELAEKMNISPTEIIKILFSYEIMANINQMIDFDTASIVCEELHVEVKLEEDEDLIETILAQHYSDPSKLKARPPIITVMGHVDHGKTSLLDYIKKTNVISGEAGGITQHIGAYTINTHDNAITFIDTPGHHAFTTLRARGGALADMAIVVVDINEGFQPQTIEALNILRNCRTPFVVALTKVDRIHGWRSAENASFLTSFAKQNERVTEFMETRHYEIVGKLSDLGFNSERFDRVSDFAREIAIVPISARTGEGLENRLAQAARAATTMLPRAYDSSLPSREREVFRFAQ